MNLPEDQDPLWNLLAKSPPPAPSPRFAARVARAVRELPSREPMFRAVFAARPRLAWGVSGGLTAAAAALALGLFLRDDAAAPSTHPVAPAYAAVDPLEEDRRLLGAPDAFDPATEIEAVEHLAQLMAVLDPDTLSDELFADLLF